MNRLFIFNPDCELAIANGGRYFTPSANVARMTEDLAFLPAWMGDKGDYVLTKHDPGEIFTEEVCLPLNLSCRAITEEGIADLPALKAEPWGWSPKLCHWAFERGIGPEWQTEWKEWYSRKVAREGLSELTERLSFIEPEIIPAVCYSLDDLTGKTAGGKDWLVKAPWSSSGKGILSLKGGVGSKEKEWLSGMFRRQGYLMLERKLVRIIDFAMEFRAGNEGVEFIGWSQFTTGTHGEYQGNYVGPQKNIVGLLDGYIGEPGLKALKETMPQILAGLLPFYRGYLGVDMMIYENEKGKMCLHPCVEINLRYNMGIIAFCLSRNFLAEDTAGEYTVSFYPETGKALSEHLQMKQTYPAVYKNNRIESGYLNLTPVTETSHFIASLRCY